MRIFNADGSEAMMRGNKIRCVGKYLSLQTWGGKVTEVTVSMWKSMPDPPVTLNTAYGVVKITPVSMGSKNLFYFFLGLVCDAA